MAVDKVSLAEKFSFFSEQWRPKSVGLIDDYEVKIVKIEGDFTWHKHDDADEMFLVFDGRFRMDFRDRQVELTKGEMIIVPRGVEHKPYAEDECQVVLFERQGIVNTGDAAGTALTAPGTERI